MPFRSQALLEQWVAEFAAGGPDVEGVVEVLPQDGYGGADNGLIVVRLKHVPIDVWMQPVAPGDPHWETTFSRREVDLAMDVERLRGLAAEVTVAAELCAFLEQKSITHVETHPAPAPA